MSLSMFADDKLHELARLDLLSQELCRKQAWKIATATARPEQRGDVIHRYGDIAQDLYSLRRKPLSAEQIKRVNDAYERFMSGVGLTSPEAKAVAKFKRVKNDRKGTDEKQERAKQKFNAVWKRVHDRQSHLLTELLIARDAAGTFPVTRADRLLARWKTDKKKFYWKFARVIQRYCDQCEKGRHPSSTNGPLLEMMCIEWRRNDKALWRFLSACFRTWDNVKNDPENVLKRRSVVHEMAPVLGRDPVKIQTHLQAIGALPPVIAGLGDVQERQEKLITKDISRGLSKARTRSFGGW